MLRGEAVNKSPFTAIYFCSQIHIKTHDSESRGQEEAAVRDERVSYLQVALAPL